MRRHLVAVLLLVACGRAATATSTATSTSTSTSTATAASPAAGPAQVPALPPPAEVAAMDDATFDAMMRRVLGLFEALGAAAQAADGDCGSGARAIDHLITGNLGFLRQLKLLDQDPTVHARAEAWTQAHTEPMTAAVVKVATLGQACAQDAAFTAALARLQTLR